MDDSLGIRVSLIRVPGKTFRTWDQLPDVYVQLEHGTPRTIASPADTAQQLLGVFVSLDISGRVFSARGEGTYLRRRELNDMRMFANEHADWSDYELIEELKKRGARFPGNADQFRQAVRLNRFEQVIGKIQETALRFELRRDVPDRPPMFDFRWIVDVATELAPSVRDSFVLVFEPFDGRLVSVTGASKNINHDDHDGHEFENRARRGVVVEVLFFSAMKIAGENGAPLRAVAIRPRP